MPCAASEVPEMSPPPPTGVMTTSRSGSAARSSRAAVPAPAMTSGLSYGWISMAPVSASTSARVVRGPRRSTRTRRWWLRSRPPSPASPPTVRRHHHGHRDPPDGAGGGEGGTVVARRVGGDAPLRRFSASSSRTALVAPRNLKAPPRWRYSALADTSAARPFVETVVAEHRGAHGVVGDAVGRRHHVVEGDVVISRADDPGESLAPPSRVAQLAGGGPPSATGGASPDPIRGR